MSHRSVITCAIKNPTMANLTEAVQRVTSALDGVRFTETVHTDDGHERVDMAIFADGLPNGLGLSWKDGQGLRFIGDSYRQKLYHEVIEALVMQYQQIAIRNVMAKRKFTVNANTHGLGTRVVCERAA